MSLKKNLRGEMKKRLNKTAGEEFRFQGEQATALLRSSPIWSGYSAFFLFLSMDTEIDSSLLFKAALESGKKVFAPKVETERLVFYPVLSAGGPWNKGPFGIREPFVDKTQGKDPAGAGDFPALIIAPGLAFDRNGNRLGRGRGFYDRFFAELETESLRYFALGLCMDFQLVDQVPVEENDKKMDCILTCKTLIYPGKEQF